MTLIEDVRREVEASVWCDSMEWRGRRVTLRKAMPTIPVDDITGSKIVAAWRRELEAVKPRSVRVSFIIKTYGCVRKKRANWDPTSVATQTHCWAVFEIMVH